MYRIGDQGGKRRNGQKKHSTFPFSQKRSRTSSEQFRNKLSDQKEFYRILSQDTIKVTENNTLQVDRRLIK